MLLFDSNFVIIEVDGGRREAERPKIVAQNNYFRLCYTGEGGDHLSKRCVHNNRVSSENNNVYGRKRHGSEMQLDLDGR